MATKPKPRALAVELIVRRGALQRFDKLKKKTAALPVKLLWDRRQSDRRTASDEADSERRKIDRRKKPPFTWDLSDFVVVAATRSSARKKKPKKKPSAL